MTYSNQHCFTGDLTFKKTKRNEQKYTDVTHTLFYFILFICIIPRGSITYQQPKHTQTHHEYRKTHTQP